MRAVPRGRAGALRTGALRTGALRMGALRMGALRTAAVGAGLSLLVAGCGSGGGSTAGGSASASASAASTSAICQDVTALRSSLSQLQHISVGPTAVSDAKTNLAAVKAKLATLTADAGSQWKVQTSALTAALAKLQREVTNLSSQSSVTGAVASLTTALGEVTTAGRNLLRVASTRCPSASPSP